MRWAGPVNRADSVMLRSRLINVFIYFQLCVHMEAGLAWLGEISPRAIGGISVKRDKIFHMNTSSHLTRMDIFADFDLEYSIEQRNLKIQTIK